MEILRKLFAWAVVAVIVGVIVLFARPSYRQGEAAIAGKTAEDFNFDSTDPPAPAGSVPRGKFTRLSDLKGKVVVLNFWASWCAPCVQEAPALNHLQEHIAPRGGMILGVSIDEDPAAYQTFLKDYAVPFPTWRDPSKKIMHDYGTILIPETYIIDRHGRIARKIIGPQQWDSPDLTSYFDYLLSQS